MFSQNFDKNELTSLAELYLEIGKGIVEVESFYNQLEASYYFEESLSIQRKLHSNEPHLDLIQITSTLGQYYCRSPNLLDKNKGIMCQLEAIDLYKKLYGERADQEFKMAVAYSNLGASYAGLGDKISLEKNIDLQLKALHICNNLDVKKFDLIKANIFNNQALSYMNIGGRENIYKALELTKKSLNICLEVFEGQANLLMAKILNNLGVVYQYISNHEIEFREEFLILNLYYVKKALSMREQIYDKKPHESIIESLNDLSVAYIHLGGEQNLSKGDYLQKRALEMCESLHITDSNSIKITIMDNLSYIESELADISHAKIMEEEPLMQEDLSTQPEILFLDNHYDQSNIDHNDKILDISLTGDTLETQ